MRFLHLADVHLDTLFAGRSTEIRRRLREASREALRRGLELARTERVDAVLVAGDLFDGARLSLATERFLARELTGLAEAGIPFLHVTGNHDPASDFARDPASGPTVGGRTDWPGEIHRFEGPEPRTVQVMRDGRVVGTVTGAGHETDREDRDLSRGFRPPSGKGVPSVALLHTQVGGARGDDDHDRYAPSELPRLREAGFDYWALGHIHLRQVLSTLPGIHYPGNTQGRSPRETGAKGGLLVELTAPGAAPDVTFVDLAPVRWETLVIRGLSEAGTLAALLRHLETAWAAARRGDPGLPGTEWMVRLELSGPCPLHRMLQDAAEHATLAEEAGRLFGALEVEIRTAGLRPALDPGPALERQDAAGETLRLLQSLVRPGGPSPSEALGLGVDDLAGHPGLGPGNRPALDAYLRELLEGGDLELLERFLQGGEAP
ncbi:MAG: exonuclease SbcCD subunit D [Gemmatimonadales bacterium]|nr:MAG: exonuclease SbcCD subunit D [Gemmatimonadales bacterium]